MPDLDDVEALAQRALHLGLAATDPSYLLVYRPEASLLVNYRTLAVGAGLSLTDGGRGGLLTLTNTGLAHAILSAQHSDSVAAAVQAGDLIFGGGAGWTRLAIGAANTVLGSSGASPSWVRNLDINRLTVEQDFYLAGVLTPAQITADQIDYNPPGLATAAVLRLSTSAAWSITGLAGGTAGRIFIVVNVGTSNLTLANENTSSLAANRFSAGQDVTLTGGSIGTVLQYDAVSSRWRMLGRGPHPMTTEHAVTGTAGQLPITFGAGVWTLLAPGAAGSVLRRGAAVGSIAWALNGHYIYFVYPDATLAVGTFMPRPSHGLLDKLVAPISEANQQFVVQAGTVGAGTNTILLASSTDEAAWTTRATAALDANTRVTVTAFGGWVWNPATEYLQVRASAVGTAPLDVSARFGYT